MAILTGDADDNNLTGGAEDDRLQGKEGDDRLKGRGGEDEIQGGTGDDRLFGGRGADELKDGFGVDKLFGGRGADVFEFVRLEGVGGRERDIVGDFQDGRDLINLSAVTRDFADLRIRDTGSGDVKIVVGDRVILLRDRDDTLAAADLTVDDFILS